MFRKHAIHTRKFAVEQENTLRTRYPGIEAWLEENGPLVDWTQAWSAYLRGEELTIPCEYERARVGCTGTLGAALPVAVQSRISTQTSVLSLSGPHPRACPYRVHVHVRLSVGLCSGEGTGTTHVPSDPAAVPWPLPAHATPEYAINKIVGERNTRRGRQYQVRWANYANHVTWEPADALAGTTALDAWLLSASDRYPFAMRGDRDKLNQVLNIHNLSDQRKHTLNNLLAGMNRDGIILFQREYPSSAGGVQGGRATFRDMNGKGNTFLTCAEIVRTYVFGEYYHEVDISRSHISMVFGSWQVTGRPAPLTLKRFRDDQADLERDITHELALSHPRLTRELQEAVGRGGGVPTKKQQRRIGLCRSAIAKAENPVKTVYSAIINAPDLRAWHIPFDQHPTLRKLITDLGLMRTAIPLHPLCAPYAQALTTAGTPAGRVRSLCMGHLDEQALSAATVALQARGCLTGVTINDSLTVACSSPLSPTQIGDAAASAATAHLQFPVTFKILPHLQTLGTLQVTLASVALELTGKGSNAPVLNPHESHFPTDSDSSRNDNDADDAPAAPGLVLAPAPALAFAPAHIPAHAHASAREPHYPTDPDSSRAHPETDDEDDMAPLYDDQGGGNVGWDSETELAAQMAVEEELDVSNGFGDGFAEGEHTPPPDQPAPTPPAPEPDMSPIRTYTSHPTPLDQALPYPRTYRNPPLAPCSLPTGDWHVAGYSQTTEQLRFRHTLHSGVLLRPIATRPLSDPPLLARSQECNRPTNLGALLQPASTRPLSRSSDANARVRVPPTATRATAPPPPPPPHASRPGSPYRVAASGSAQVTEADVGPLRPLPMGYGAVVWHHTCAIATWCVRALLDWRG